MSCGNETLIEETLDRAALVCVDKGARLTALRRSVLRLVLAATGPVTAYQLLDRLKAIRQSAVPPTIYRALEFLLEHGLIHKVERLNAFVPCIDHDHGQHAVQFLICGRCGTVAEIEDEAIAAALAQAAGKQGFTQHRAVVELDGVCADCSQ